MTQTKSVHLLSTSQLLQTIDPQLIADDDLRMSVETLLNLRSELNQKVKKLERENQLLKDENKRLKGEQGKPEIKSKKKGDKNKNYSCEKERKISQNKSKSRKNQNIKIDREEILDYDKDQLPKDAIFKGYEEVIVQDIKLVTDNIKFRKQKYYSPSTKKTYLSQLPLGDEGQLGQLPQETVLDEEEFKTLLDEHLRGLGKVQRNRVQEASAIAYYHQQSDCPIIKTLICDDAPQFKLLTEELS